MDVDIRIPIGLLFAILGLILTIFGLATLGDSQIYIRSLGVNINLWTGILMLVFGSSMLIIILKKKKSNK